MADSPLAPCALPREDRFTMNTCDRRERVWRRCGERSAACNILHYDRFGDGSVMVWRGTSLEGGTELASEHRPLLWTFGPHTTFMDSVSHSLSRNMHISGLLKVVLQGSGSAPPLPHCTKDQIAVLLLGGCPPTAPYTSPGVLACLLVRPPCSGHPAGRHIKPSCHSAH